MSISKVALELQPHLASEKVGVEHTQLAEFALVARPAVPGFVEYLQGWLRWGTVRDERI